MAEKEIREWKSNSFSLLMKDKDAALEVYNYLNNSSYTNKNDLEIEEIDGGINISVRNDALFVLDGYVNLYEHQSTVNPNIPLRQLIYVGAYYKNYIKKNNLNVYGSTKITLPTPQFAVFYNGIAKQEESKILKLSSSYQHSTEDPELELKCCFYNINSGYNKEMKRRCPSIEGYVRYVEKVRENEKTMDTVEAIETAIDECISEGVLTEFFKENKNMIISADALDFTYETRLKLERRDAHEEGRKAGLKEGINKGLEEGISKGLKEGINKGKKEGIKEGIKEGNLNSIKNLMETMNWTADTAMDALKIPNEDREILISMLSPNYIQQH